MSDLSVSVVIPSQGRRETRVAFALEALAAQTLAPERFEVLVVRDPGPGPHARAPEELRARFLWAPRPTGPAAKRNIGWRAAEAPLVAFTDDDCRPAPGWLAALVAAAGSGVVVQGRTEADPDERHILWGLAKSQVIQGPSRWYESCNIAYPREMLERLGGFDERFPGVGGEDTDLGLRALESGAHVEYADDAVVWHAVHTRALPGAVREARQWGHMPLVLSRHPSQRGALYARLFWRRSHALLMLASLGLLVRRPAAAVLALPYLAHHLDSYDRSPLGVAGGLIDLPARALAEAVELAAIARGAARYRAPML